ncbi:hypothetical protein AgCh_013636 [Apium graveolens]
MILRDESDSEEETIEARVHASEPVTVEAENVTSHKETAAQSSDTLKRKSVTLPFPTQAQDTVSTPPVSPLKATDDAEEQATTSEIDIHNLNIPTVLYLEAPSTAAQQSPTHSPILDVEIPSTPALEINSDAQNLNEVVPESPVASHILVLSEHNESSSSSEDSVSVETPAPILGKEELVKKFVEHDAPVPWEETHRGVEWTKNWNESDFIPSTKILTVHVPKADELLSNSDFKTQLKVTAMSTRSLHGLHSITHDKKAQLDEIQSSVELLLSLLLPDDAKKGKKVIESKCSPTKILKKKDDKGDDQGNYDKSKGKTSQKLKGKQTTVYYKDPKIQTLDEEIARRLFLKQNPGIDLETLKEEVARFAVEKTNLKSKASDAKKPPRPKEKGIVIKEKSNSKASKSNTRSQTEIDPKSKGKEKRRKLIEESKTTSDTAQVVQNEEQLATDEIANSDQAIKTSTTDNDQVDLKKMTIADKKKLLWKKATLVEPKSNLMINQLATFGLRAKQPRDRAGLGSDEEKIQTGVEVTLRDPFMLTDKPYEQIKQKHLDKVLSAQIVIDAHDKENLKEKLIVFLNDGRTYRLADTDVLKKSVRELQHIHYLLEVKYDITRRWSEYILKAIRDLLRISGTKASQYIPMITEDDGREIPMLKNSAKVEVILKGRCLCYNEDSSHPRVIRLGDVLERTSIQALRTTIYEIGESKDEELMQVKAQLVEVLRKAEDKLIREERASGDERKDKECLIRKERRGTAAMRWEKERVNESVKMSKSRLKSFSINSAKPKNSIWKKIKKIMPQKNYEEAWR